MGKNDGILGAIGGLVAAIAGEVDIIGPSISSSSPSSPSTSGSGSHSDSHGGGDGSSSTDWMGITERTNAQGKTVNQIVRVGNKDHVYPAGYTGFIDALLGGKPVAVSEFNGDKINHQDANGKTVATSIIRSDGRIDSWGSNGQFLGSKTPTFSANQASQTITPSSCQSETNLDWLENNDDDSDEYWHALLENDIDDLNRVVNNCYIYEQSSDKERLESSKHQLGSDCIRLIRIAEDAEQLLRIQSILNKNDSLNNSGITSNDDESVEYWHALLENDIDDLNRIVNNCYAAEQSGDKEKLKSSQCQLELDCVRLIRIAENTEQLLRIKAILDTPAHIQGYLEALKVARDW